MGRAKRGLGALLATGGFTMTLVKVGADGAESWLCGKCGKPASVSAEAVGYRGHDRVLKRHLKGCAEAFWMDHGGVHLSVVSGVAQVVVARGVFSSAECALALAALADLPPGGFHAIDVGGDPDARQQIMFRVGGKTGEGLGRLVRVVIDAMAKAYPGWCLRGSHAFVLQGGKVDQPGHCDYMCNSRGVVQEDSVTVFISLSAGGRGFGLEGGGGGASTSGAGGCLCAECRDLPPWYGACWGESLFVLLPGSTD
jgi:hypothetical protein